MRDRILECLTISHEGGGRNDTVARGFNDSAIYTPSKPKIIRINNQAPHATQSSSGERSALSNLHLVPEDRSGF